MQSTFIKKDTCLICNSKDVTRYLSLGESAFANSYVKKRELHNREPKAPLDVYFCNNCKLVQLLDIVDRGLLFKTYYYFSSTSPVLVNHFESYAKDVVSMFPSQSKKLIIDIGSNDGILLKPFKDLGCDVLGIDPAVNISKQMKKSDIETLWEFFGSSLVPTIQKKYKKPGIICANNVLAHTDMIHDILEGVRLLLDETGIFIFEVQYIRDLLNKNEFDNTYHEHICYYSLMPIIYLLNMHNMSVFDVKHVETHGGSLRVFASLATSKIPVSSSVEEMLNQEKEAGLDTLETYLKFAKIPSQNKNTLRKMLLQLKHKNKKIVGYGAPAKAATLLQYCQIGPEIIDYITDAAPSKQGLFLPGVHIPIVSPSVLSSNTPDYIVVLAWNYAENIIKKESWFRKNGGKFIIPVPTPRILE